MNSTHATLKVWDLGVRVLHWLLVALVAGLGVTAPSDEDGMRVTPVLGVHGRGVVV